MILLPHSPITGGRQKTYRRRAFPFVKNRLSGSRAEREREIAAAQRARRARVEADKKDDVDFCVGNRR